MATIYPFKAIRPNPSYFSQPRGLAAKNKFNLDDCVINDCRDLKGALELEARVRPETKDGQIMAFNKINQSLQGLMDNYQLWHEKNEGFYVYEVNDDLGNIQTGIWTLTAIQDYLHGSIRTHELTLKDSVRRLTNYRNYTGIEGSPVVLIHHPDENINMVIGKAKQYSPKTSMLVDGARHSIWKIDDQWLMAELVNIFAAMPMVYLADGHHRLEAAADLYTEQREKGEEGFDRISSLYMATDQIRIKEFHRVVTPNVPVNPFHLIERLEEDFMISTVVSKQLYKPIVQKRFGMLLKNKWYNLDAKDHTCNYKQSFRNLDYSILQDFILSPVFGINDPKADKRLTCIGGSDADEKIMELVGANPELVVFTTAPLSVKDLLAVADAGNILPPKSTWIDPKIPYGLLINKLETCKTLVS